MELRDITIFLLYNRKLLVSAAVFFALAGLFIARLLPPQFEAVVDLYVYRTPVESTVEYSYEGYYAQQSSKELADTVVGFLSSVNTAEKALVEGGLKNATAESAFKLSKSVGAKTIANNVIRFSLKRSSSEEAESLLNSLMQSALSSLKEKMLAEQGLVSITPLGEPLVREVSFSPLMFSLAFSLLGTIFTTLLICFRAYLAGSWVEK